MTLQYFDIASLTASPWKNGGGTTREIVCAPAGADMDGFDWRVSIATIDRSGPFSAFVGIDRVIMLLDGAGVRLHSSDGRIEHRLDQPYVPFAFAGDVALDSDLLAGTSTDFNVMSRRSRLSADVRVLHGNGDIETVERGLLLALRGRWHLNERVCESGSGLWWEGEPQSWQARSTDVNAVLVVVRIEPAGVADK